MTKMKLASWINTKAGQSVAGDLGLYYHHQFGIGSKDALWALGWMISNMGTPISYQVDALTKTPIPTSLRLGGRFTIKLDESNSLSLNAEANKLLISTPPVYSLDTITDQLILTRGMEPPETVLKGMVQSFYDAPGVSRPDGSYSVFREEIAEVAFSIGAEYRYKKLFALRSGYHHENQAKGNRRYFTLGLGGGYKFLVADISYLIAASGQNSPLANTFRFTLTAAF